MPEGFLFAGRVCYDACAMPALFAVVHGTVQGVGFRYFVSRQARALGLAGHALNRADGSVEIYAEGSRAALDRLLDRLREGPVGSRVARVESRFTEADRGLDGFDVG